VLGFEIQAVCPTTGARAGILHTAHGDVETPVFMPVGTQATVKGILPRELIDDLDAKIILGNTYHLFLRPGHETIQKLGGLHKFMAWPRAILTDSGGFQVFSLNSLRKITEQGVLFRSHLNGDAHLFTPESTIDVQLALGSDVMMVLDECLEYPASHEAARASTDRTVRWAQKAYKHYRDRSDGQRRCFPIVQGSMYADLRRQCAEQLMELDADGYAIGGLSVGEPRALSLEMAEVTAALLPRDRPRYVMGVGMPEELPQYVGRGVDMMDCVLPSRNARNGYLFTSTGRVIIKQTRYKDDSSPIDPSCQCYTCQNFSRAYLRHLFLAGEMTFSTLATLHNLRQYLDIMREIRQAILLGKFPEFLKAVSLQVPEDQPS
jgi:queuine tRNA-ribosyltransferase